MARRILVVEDDPGIAGVVAENLRDFGFEAERAGTLAEARARLRAGRVDLIVLDLSLPDGDGLDLCRDLRERGNAVPVLVLTARGSEPDRVLGLELGADDYLTKPFGVRELVARVRALLRRAERAVSADPAEEAPVERRGLRIDPARRRVWVEGRSVALTATEFDLLLHLARHPGRVFTRAQLLEAVWGYGHEGYEHTVNSHINRLRAKIEDDPRRPRYVRTVWGVGYTFPDDEDGGAR
ncbi:response regulator transcription factor [Deferrisoma sp.]